MKSNLATNGSRIVLLIGVYILSCQELLAQDRFESSDGYQQQLERLYTIGIDGQLRSYEVAVSRPIQLESSVLTNDRFRKELELTHAQRTKIDRIAEDVTKELEQFTEHHNNDGIDKESINRYVDAIKNAEKKLDDIPLPHQAKAIGQIKLRYRMRQRGLLRMLLLDELGTELKVTTRQKQQLLERAKEFQTVLKGEVQKLKADCFERLLGVLPNDRRKKVESNLEENSIDLSRTNFSVLIWQLRREDEKIERKPLRFQGLRSNITFKIAIDGELVPSYVGYSKDNRVYTRILGMLATDEIAKSLELVDEQKVTVAEIQRWASDLSNEINLEFQESSEPKLAIAKLGERNKTRWDSTAEKIQKLLLPHQLTEIEQIAERAELARVGILSTLVNGRLGVDIELSEKDREGLLSKAEELCDELIAESRNLEKKTLESISEVLSSEQKELLDDRLGPSLKHSYANLDLLVELLTIK